jgi:hypothetical protein
MATILMNVSKKKFNKCFTMYGEYNYHIVNENARKTLCNLFDALGNISSYNDYNAFMEKYSGFSKFNKCTISRKLKIPIELSQGILVVVDSKTGELSLPTTKQLEWFLDKYQYSTSTIISDDKPTTDEVIEVKEETREEPKLETKEEVVKQETREEPKLETKEEVVKQETLVEVRPKEPVKSSGGFWSYFGWN